MDGKDLKDKNLSKKTANGCVVLWCLFSKGNATGSRKQSEKQIFTICLSNNTCPNIFRVSYTERNTFDNVSSIKELFSPVKPKKKKDESRTYERLISRDSPAWKNRGSHVYPPF